MEICCGDTMTMDCLINDIIQRITPIEYIDDTLVVNSSVSVNTSVSINDVVIGGGNGVLFLPDGTTVGGTPLISAHYVNDNYVLPDKTLINGFPILNTNYFYYYTVNTAGYSLISGCFINNNRSITGTPDDVSFVGNYPFIVPWDCVLTSLLFSLVVDSSGVSNIINAFATIYIMSGSNVWTNTGVSTSTIAICPNGSRYYSFANFQYQVQAADRIGVRVSYTGSATSNKTAFATLGYKFL